MTLITDVKYKQFILIAAIVSAFVLIAPYGLAQEAAPTTKSEEVKKLEELKAQAELRKAIAEADKAALQAEYPKSSATPLEGKTTLNDGAVIESQMISYVSMATVAGKIADSVGGRDGVTNLAIYNGKDVELLLLYKVAKKRVTLLKEGYCKFLSKGVFSDDCPSQIEAASPALFTVGQSFLGAFVDLTALLRTNVEIRGQTFDIDEAPLVAAFFKSMRMKKSAIKLYYPSMFPPDIDPGRDSEILRLLEKVRNLRIKTEKLIGDLEKKSKEITGSEDKIKSIDSAIQELTGKKRVETAAANRLLEVYCPGLAKDTVDILAKIEKAQKGACPKAPYEKRESLFQIRDNLKDFDLQLSAAEKNKSSAKARQDQLKMELGGLEKKLDQNFLQSSGLDDAIAQLKAQNEQFDKFVSSLIQADTVGINALTSYIRAENLKAALPDQGSFWLQIKVLKAGGNNRIKTNLITDIFTGGNRISHNGGAIAQYFLFDTSGNPVGSDIVADYTDYIKASKIKDLRRE